MHISIIGRPGSKAVSKIVKLTPLTRYSSKCDILVNYGLAGERLQNFKDSHKSYHKKLILNEKIGFTKFKGIKLAADLDIKVPKSFLILPEEYKASNFLTKKMHSQGGIGIKLAKSHQAIPDKYYQEFIKNRKFELRIHGFLWQDSKEWEVQKRFGKEGEIAWNFHNGGRFQTVHNASGGVFSSAKEAAVKMLKIMGMAFGAADFLVTDKNELYFIEMNSAPGFTEFSEKIYTNAFTKLTTITKAQISKYI